MASPVLGGHTVANVTPVRDAAADRRTVEALEALIERVKLPLTKLNVSDKALHDERKAMLKKLEDAKASPEVLPTANALSEMGTRAAAIETSF